MTGEPISTVAMPARVAALPRDRAGRPVPWFAAWIEGEPEFRVIAPGKRIDALRFGSCWVCGQKATGRRGFVIGPMCVVNRVTAEPPAHVDCAVYSARVCPFLTRPAMVRRTRSLPAGVEPPPGIMLERNPGVAVVWVARHYRLVDDGRGGVLLRLGDPERVEWYRQGRPATRAEVDDAIDAGLPALRELAEQDGGLGELDRMVAAARTWLP